MWTGRKSEFEKFKVIGRRESRPVYRVRCGDDVDSGGFIGMLFVSSTKREQERKRKKS